MVSAQTFRILIDVLLVFMVVSPTIVLYVARITPTKRGFFCGDESIRYPYIEADTVTSTMVAALSVALPVVVIVATEVVRFKFALEDDIFIDTKQLCGVKNFNPCFYTICGYLWTLQLGAMITQVLTDVGKYSVGRLRPNFILACEPNITLTSCVANEYITNFECQRNNPDLINFIRTSFPSGHSSQSAYVAVFLCYYVQMRVSRCAFTYLFKHLLQYIFISMAWICGLSRVMDYKHHPTDVLAGFLIGLLVAILTAKYVAKSFRDPYRSDDYNHTSMSDCCFSRQNEEYELRGQTPQSDFVGAQNVTNLSKIA